MVKVKVLFLFRFGFFVFFWGGGRGNESSFIWYIRIVVEGAVVGDREIKALRLKEEDKDVR